VVCDRSRVRPVPIPLVFLSKSAQRIENKGREGGKKLQERSRVRKHMRMRGLHCAAARKLLMVADTVLVENEGGDEPGTLSAEP
jgi:hypothetical protein